MNSTVVRDSCWELDVPVTCVTCSKDPRVRVTEAMVAKMKKENWTVNTMECGCSPFLSHVEELGEMILKAGQMG